MSKPDLFKNVRSPYVLSYPVTRARYRRIDMLRGLAVLGISVNHIWYHNTESAGVVGYKFGHFFTFDFGDVFLLTSGIVAGIFFFPLLLKSGARKCLEKSFRRAGQIWLVHILCTLAALTVIVTFERNLGVTGLQDGRFDQPIAKILAEHILLYRPGPYLDILPVYIFLLIALTPALLLLRRSLSAFMALIITVWALIWVPVFLLGPGLASDKPDLGSTYFVHPMAAQLLFFTGVAIGAKKHQIETITTAQKSHLFLVAILFLVVSNYMQQMAWITHHFEQKQWVGPLRLAELLAVLCILWRLSCTMNIASASGVGFIEACGRHTLPVFAATTVTAFFFGYLVEWMEGGRLLYGLCILANVVFCVSLAQLLDRLQTTNRLQTQARSPLRPSLRPSSF